LKPVDLQVSVKTSQDVSRTSQLRGRAGETSSAQAALSFRKDMERRSLVVSDLKHSENGRIEDGEPGSGGFSGGDSKQKQEYDKEKEPAKDPKKGHMLDITAGFLA